MPIVASLKSINLLVRRRGESLIQFLIRLDRAMHQTLTLGIFTDQINR